MGLLIGFLVLLIIFGIVWAIARRIPVPPDLVWVRDVIILVLFLFAALSLFMGAWSFPFAGAHRW